MRLIEVVALCRRLAASDANYTDTGQLWRCLGVRVLGKSKLCAAVLPQTESCAQIHASMRTRTIPYKEWGFSVKTTLNHNFLDKP